MTEENATSVDAKQIVKDTTINPVDLDNEMLVQAGLFSNYAASTAKAELAMDNLKLKRDIVHAQVDKEVRDAAADEGRKVTEKLIDAEVSTDIRVVKVIRRHNELKAEFNTLKGVLEALKQKRDMLVQLGINSREEWKGEVRVKEAEAGAAAKGSTRERVVKSAAKASREAA